MRKKNQVNVFFCMAKYQMSITSNYASEQGFDLFDLFYFFLGLAFIVSAIFYNVNLKVELYKNPSFNVNTVVEYRKILCLL
jgi:hypothetical protein